MHSFYPRVRSAHLMSGLGGTYRPSSLSLCPYITDQVSQSLACHNPASKSHAARHSPTTSYHLAHQSPSPTTTTHPQKMRLPTLLLIATTLLSTSYAWDCYELLNWGTTGHCVPCNPGYRVLFEGFCNTKRDCCHVKCCK